MTNLTLSHICLMLLFSTKISPLDYNMLYFQQNKVNQASLQLLEKMGGQFPLQCLNENSNFMSLQNVLNYRKFQKENTMVAIQEILQQIFNIFSKSHIQTAWNRSSISAFQNGLHKQIEKLKTWFEGGKEMEATYPQNEDLTRLKVKKYFHVIDNFLQEKQYSLCAWEIIREKMRRCFLFIDQLTKRLQN
ncbi:interferon beta-like [Emydura macquarii macquarii]|uniref:interferon beta-like n=1 Tax=Emydura macquarii macquarii TaxID=1129001 RepID=UPI00352A3DF0